jgi:hypothetical protein
MFCFAYWFFIVLSEGPKVGGLQLSNMVENEVCALAMNYQCFINLTNLWQVNRERIGLS